MNDVLINYHKSTWLDVNTDFLRDLNTWLAALIRLWITQSCPPFSCACVMLPTFLNALDLHPVGTHLDPVGGDGRCWLIPVGGRCWGRTNTPIVLS